MICRAGVPGTGKLCSLSFREGKEGETMNNLKLETSEGIALVTIDRPKALNALNSETLGELNECLKELEQRKDIRVILLTGGGQKAFVAGADISEMVNAAPAGGRAMALLADEAFCRLENMPQVTIAAVNGYALGGGCEIAMACDIRIASENAKFAQPECGLGILPGFGGTQRLARLVGKGRAKELIFTCDRIDAQEAWRIGLVNKVVPQAELLDACRAMAQRILKNGGYAVTLAKQAINAGLDMDLANGLKMEADAFGLTFATHDKQEGMTAFLEKRPAELTDF